MSRTPTRHSKRRKEHADATNAGSYPGRNGNRKHCRKAGARSPYKSRNPLREADENIQRELNRILTDQMMRRAEIMTALEKIRSGLGQAQINGATPPALPIDSEIDLPKIARKGKDA